MPQLAKLALLIFTIPTNFAPIQLPLDHQKRSNHAILHQVAVRFNTDMETERQNYKMHPKQRKIDQALAQFLMAAGIPPNCVERGEFREIMNALDSNYVFPSEYAMTNEVRELENQHKVDILSTLTEQPRLSAICVNLWHDDKCSLELTVSAYFFDFKQQRIRRVLLGSTKLFGSLSNCQKIYNVANDILQEWNLSLESSKIFHLMTDNFKSKLKI